MTSDPQADRYRDQEEHSTQQRAAILGLHYLDTRGIVEAAALPQDVLELSEMYKWRMVPLRRGSDSQSYVFGITASTPQSALKDVASHFDEHSSVELLLISQMGFREYMRRFDPPKEVVYQDVKIAQAGDSDTLAAVSQTLESVRTDDILTYLINQADQLGASDIHLENQREDVRIRLRVDGTLHPIATISHDKYRILQSSIASKANVSTASDQPQTGHMQQIDENDPERLINMRIETVPTVYGQDTVVRMFTFDDSLLNLDRIGMDARRRKVMDDIIQHPHGMVMVVGPTGSGKSTTLYSMVNALNDPSRKILTLEDPVEISLPGISQIPVASDKGESFADKLRAVLRLDPDVVMVGEIRDADTAKTAIQASVTGHLVLSTFHAATAAMAFSRMVDMIGHNPIFANALRLIIAQRLVRRLDDPSKVAYQPDESTKRWIREVLGELPEGYDVPDIDSLTLYKAGSRPEAPFGYKGRIIIMEQLVVNDEIQAFMHDTQLENSASAIQAAAMRNGMLTLDQDAMLKVVAGETTLEEFGRVI